MNALIMYLILQVVFSFFNPIDISRKQSPVLTTVQSESLLFVDNYLCEIDYAVIPGKENLMNHIHREHSFLSSSIDLLEEKLKEKYLEQHKIVK